jgi:hypothetical protein
MAAVIDHRHAQRDIAFGTTIGIFQIDLYLGVMVLALRMHIASPAMAEAGLAAKHLFKIFTEIGCVAETCVTAATAEFKTCIRIRWWLEVLAVLPVGTQLIVGRARFGVFQYLVGFAHFLKRASALLPWKHPDGIYAQVCDTHS